ncbi:MAG: 4Fe-4S dicluster domain-containing protein [Actinobacteria bacterium]|nr:4Fe-4S dicluster domain-containing protein [Actinomycetota bacterium]
MAEHAGAVPDDHEAGGPVETEPAGGHSSFDALRPPSDDLIADCVHCGFCLPTCPTYALWGEEMDSPRGRIYLMELASAGDIAIDDVFVTHMDRCLGCMACVTACPSGVQYDKLIEATRPQIERNHPRSPQDRWFRRAVFALFPHPRRLRFAAVLGLAYQRLRIGDLLRRTGVHARLSPRLQALEELLPTVSLRDIRRHLPARVAPRRLPGDAAAPTPAHRVGLITGCVQSVFFGDVNTATARVLAMEGCEVVIPDGQGCCGALMEHAGQEESALAYARRMIATMEEADVDRIAINAAGCGSTLKEYGHLLRDDEDWAERAAAFSDKVRDISELLDELEPRAARHPIPARVAYHDACHLSHAQGVRRQPRAALRAIPELELVELSEPDICCGSAGIYNLLEPEAASDLGVRKAATVAAVAPDAVVTANPGCTLQIKRHLQVDIPLLHPVQVVDASLRGRNPFV